LAGSVHTDAYRFLVDQLKAARKRGNISQQELADRLGRPQSFVAKVEGYERRIDVIEYALICYEVGLDPAEPLRSIVSLLGYK